MTSLTEVYEGNERAVASPRRVYAGTALVLAGAAFGVLALLVATTDLFGAFVTGTYETREVAGILGGLAVPVALVGVFTVLPADRRVQATAAISAALCLLGVALFRYAYPHHWDGYGRDLTFHVSSVYLVGLFTAVWALFTAVATFKRRNDPGGALEMNVTRRGRTKVVEVADSSGFGGVGLFGGQPDGDVETQTNQPGEVERDEPTVTGSSTSGSSPAGSTASGSTATTASSSGAATTGSAKTSSRRKRAAPAGNAAASDGGAATTDITSPLDDGDAEFVDEPTPTEPADRYCGNCRHFEYVRSSSGMVPYCGRHDEAMDDMDACEEWTPNRN